MFGAKPGSERNQGVMNQHIVSSLRTEKMTYWVLHTRGEDAVSVLISSLTKEARRKQLDAEAEQRSLLEVVSAVRVSQALTTKEGYDNIKDLKLLAWGTLRDPKTLETLVNTATTSCVLGYCATEDESADE